MDLSVVIACSRPGKLLICLEGFCWQESSYEFEVIAVGDVPVESGDYPFPCKFIPTDNPHVNARRNRGINEALADHIALMDDDCVPMENWVNEAVQSSTLNYAVVSGREIPYLDNAFSQITHAVLSSPIGEMTSAHVNRRAETVKWYEVAFCNCIIPKKLFQIYGLSEAIPWDMDDFHFCNSVKNEAVFVNNPNLVVKHDRYPSNMSELIQYKWKLRVRTGEKIVSHPGIYLKIPAVIASSLLIPLLIIAFSSIGTSHFLLLAAFIAYFLLLLTIGYQSGRKFGFIGILYSISVLACVHGITAIAIQYGIFRGLQFGRFNKG